MQKAEGYGLLQPKLSKIHALDNLISNMNNFSVYMYYMPHYSETQSNYKDDHFELL